jgi:hypothetical protein
MNTIKRPISRAGVVYSVGHGIIRQKKRSHGVFVMSTKSQNLVRLRSVAVLT